MTTAASLLIDTLIPAAKTAAPDVGVPGGAPGQSLFMTSFTALLAEGNFVQAPGLVPTEGEGTPSLAALLSLGEAGAAADGEFDPAVPAFNVIPLFDTTSLSTPAPANPIPGLGLGVTSLISNGASSDGSNAAPTGDSSVASALAPAAGLAAKSVPTTPADSPATGSQGRHGGGSNGRDRANRSPRDRAGRRRRYSGRPRRQAGIDSRAGYADSNSLQSSSATGGSDGAIPRLRNCRRIDFRRTGGSGRGGARSPCHQPNRPDRRAAAVLPGPGHR